MTKAVKERLDKQLREVQMLISEIDTISERLRQAADRALEAMATRQGKGNAGGPR